MRRRFFTVLCITGMLALLSSTMSKSPVLNPYAEYLFSQNPGTPTYLLGFVAAASTIPGVLVSLPAGTLSDRIGRGKVLFLSAVVFASAPFLYLLVVTPVQLIFVRFYHGFATAVFGPVANAAIVTYYPESKGEKVSLFSSIVYVGRFMAPLLGGYVLFVTASDYHQYYFIDWVIGVSALVFALGLLEKRREDFSNAPSTLEKSTGRHNGWREVASNRKILVTSFVEATQYYTFGAFEFFLIGYAVYLGIGPLYLGVLAFVQPFTVFAAKPLMGRLSDKIGRRTPIRIGLVTGAISLILLPLAWEFFSVAVVAVFYGLGFSLVTSSTPPLVSDLSRKEASGSAMGFLGMVMDVGQVLGPIVTGFVLVLTNGYFWAFALLGLVQFIAFTAFSASSTEGKL